MALYPRVQARAQAELSKVLGSSFERLPCFADRPKIPYVNAMVKEILRWNPAVPLGSQILHCIVPKRGPEMKHTQGLPIV